MKGAKAVGVRGISGMNGLGKRLNSKGRGAFDMNRTASTAPDAATAQATYRKVIMRLLPFLVAAMAVN